MQLFVIKVLLESDRPIYRDLLVPEIMNLQELHEGIKKAFNFKGNELASFVHEDGLFGAEVEIPLENLGDDEISLMKDVALNEILGNEGDQLTYVYDFISDWKFYIELLEKKEGTAKDKEIRILKKHGLSPDENSKQITGEDAESILMNAILGEELSDDEFDDSYSDDMDSIDDYEDFM